MIAFLKRFLFATQTEVSKKPKVIPFDQAIEFVFKHEGGYVNDPLDPGGETKFGISKRSWPHIDIKNLTYDQAAEIYRDNYWDEVGGDLLPYSIALAVFDFAVNSGVSTAVKCLQTQVGAVPDGKFGPNTLREIQEEIRIVGEKRIAIKLCSDRADYFVSIVKSRPHMVRFLRGWMSRVFNLIEEII